MKATIENYRVVNLHALLEQAEHDLKPFWMGDISQHRNDAEEMIDTKFSKNVTWGDDGSVFVTCEYALSVLADADAASDSTTVGAFIGFVRDTLGALVPEEDRTEVLVELYRGV